MTPLEDRINELPPEMRREVEDFSSSCLRSVHGRAVGRSSSTGPVR